MDVANVLNTQAQNAAAASKDWEKYESFKNKAKEPTPADISQSIPPSEATKHSDGMQNQLRSFQFTNDKNIERERGIHEQLVQQLKKDGYMTKAAIISQAHSSRSDKGHGLLAT